ncbi:hypothetical protein SAMN05421630_101621 [Prauserella marina]|uniref:Uncharacterized protein n=2 Tax=Prauserella marina TaxID=530584 RepID=A0A1G6J9R1_9PSEU|nr:hypothetical protein DES30_101715 [Prauserella marina]SDC15480.1 hypothetical protein SAMN05421630_101621 [Prauserella marina]
MTEHGEPCPTPADVPDREEQDIGHYVGRLYHCLYADLSLPPATVPGAARWREDRPDRP